MIIAYRYRLGWRGRLILQVGERVLFYPDIPGVEWRDARVTDLKGGKPPVLPEVHTACQIPEVKP